MLPSFFTGLLVFNTLKKKIAFCLTKLFPAQIFLQMTTRSSRNSGGEGGKSQNQAKNKIHLPPPLFGQVFEAALAWIRYDREQREPFLPELLAKIRLPLCRPQFLADRVQQDDLVRCCHKCR